ncbi:MAG TPA: hypothetical protein VK993_00475, partial [Chthoniobacterales bacterium]|nr:hypothetical protein [Chthoniobacterales bacterium]
TPPVVGTQPGAPLTVRIPTVSFGAVPVSGSGAIIERLREVVIRDVTGGQGAGVYNLTIQNNRLLGRRGFDISFTAADGSPINSVTVPPGGETSFFVRTVADGRVLTDNPGEFQWYVTATAASGDTLRMPFYYRAVAAVPGIPAQLQNISTRLRVQTGDNVGIAGFIVTGSDPKRVVVRGIGPSLRADGGEFPGRLEDPTLELFDQNGNFIVGNDNWRDSQQQAIQQSGLAPEDDRESAILRTLTPGIYTVVLRGKAETTGVGLVEAYDIETSDNSKLANISTRGFVDTGEDVMIGGLIVGPAERDSTRVMVRAIGPSLAARGVAGALQDPTIALHDANGAAIAANDNWKESQQADIERTSIPPPDDRESAIVRVLPAGIYTAIVRGQGNSTGVGLVEAYNLGAP